MTLLSDAPHWWSRSFLAWVTEQVQERVRARFEIARLNGMSSALADEAPLAPGYRWQRSGCRWEGVAPRYRVVDETLGPGEDAQGDWMGAVNRGGGGWEAWQRKLVEAWFPNIYQWLDYTAEASFAGVDGPLGHALLGADWAALGGLDGWPEEAEAPFRRWDGSEPREFDRGFLRPAVAAVAGDVLGRWVQEDLSRLGAALRWIGRPVNVYGASGDVRWWSGGEDNYLVKSGGGATPAAAWAAMLADAGTASEWTNPTSIPGPGAVWGIEDQDGWYEATWRGLYYYLVHDVDPEGLPEDLELDYSWDVYLWGRGDWFGFVDTSGLSLVEEEWVRVAAGRASDAGPLKVGNHTPPESAPSVGGEFGWTVEMGGSNPGESAVVVQKWNVEE